MKRERALLNPAVTSPPLLQLVHPPPDFPTQSGQPEVLACPECDLLQLAPARPVRLGTVECARCGATISRTAPCSLELTLAFAVAAAVVFAIANAFPIMTLELQGRRTSETLLGMSAVLQEAGMASVAALVFATIVLMPALEIACLLYLLGPLAMGRVPPLMALAARLLALVKPWAMTEILLLGALVSIGRLETVARVHVGAALWSMAALMFLFAVIDTVFDPSEPWSRADALRQVRAIAVPCSSPA